MGGDPNIPYEQPQWYLDLPLEDTHRCNCDNDCVIYCPNTADIIVSGLGMCVGSHGGDCDADIDENSGYCKHPGYLYGINGCNTLDQACECHTNYVDCFGNCVEEG